MGIHLGILLAMVAVAAGADHAAWERATSQANQLRNAGRHSDAEPMFRLALAEAEKFGPANPRVAQALNNLGAAALQAGRTGEAESLHLRSVALWESYGESEQRNLAIARTNLAAVYRASGKYAEAEAQYRKLLETHPDAAVLSGLAAVVRARGRVEEAAALYSRAISDLEKSIPPQPVALGRAWNNLAEALSTQGLYRDAEDATRRALAIWEKELGADHAFIATALNGLAQSLRLQQRFEDAEHCYLQAIAVAEKALGPQHPDTAKFYANLGHLYFERGRYAGAARLYERALPVIERAAGPNDPLALTLRRNLASVFRAEGRVTESERVAAGFRNSAPPAVATP